MDNTTKRKVVEEFKNLLKIKSFDKITVKNLCDRCDIARMTFYYHFNNIRDLVRWITNTEIDEIFENRKDGTWAEILTDIFVKMQEDSEYYVKLLNSISSTDIEAYIFNLVNKVVMQNHRIKFDEVNIHEKDKIFIINFFTYAITGVFFEFIRNGMKEDIDYIISNLKLLETGCAESVVNVFENRKLAKI